MKDDRFIELLNLYIDQQISPSEVQELEVELLTQPARQAVYRQYCQIHRATMMVGEQFQSAPADADVAARISRLREQTGSAPKTSPWIYYAGGLAAACLAVFFVRFEAVKPAPAEITASPIVAMTPATVSRPAAVAPTERLAENRPVYVSLKTIPINDTQDYAAVLSALRREERVVYGNTSSDQTKQQALFDDGVFESPRYWQENRTRDFRSHTGSQSPQAEFTGFQFQR